MPLGIVQLYVCLDGMVLSILIRGEMTFTEAVAFGPLLNQRSEPVEGREVGGVTKELVRLYQPIIPLVKGSPAFWSNTSLPSFKFLSTEIT